MRSASSSMHASNTSCSPAPGSMTSSHGSNSCPASPAPHLFGKRRARGGGQIPHHPPQRRRKRKRLREATSHPVQMRRLHDEQQVAGRDIGRLDLSRPVVWVCESMAPERLPGPDTHRLVREDQGPGARNLECMVRSKTVSQEQGGHDRPSGVAGANHRDT